MKLFGDKKTFGFGLEPLEGAPDEADRSAAETWASLAIWVRGENLASHVHATMADDLHEGLHWPVIHLARWLVHHWPSFFELQAWPIAGPWRNARRLASALDAQVADTDDEANDYDALVDRRDAFVFSHSLASAAAGGLVPDIYLARDGDRVSIAWGAPEAPSDVQFRHGPGEADIPVQAFLEAVSGLIGWVIGRLAPIDHPLCVHDRDALLRWSTDLRSGGAAERALLGYAGLGAAPASLLGQLDASFDLPEGWREHGAAFDPSTAPAAVVFRAVAPVLSLDDALGLLGRLKQFSRREAADDALAKLRDRLPSSAGMRSDFQQGYWLAIALRSQLQNTTRPLDVEALLAGLDLPIEEIDLHESIDGGAVWDEQHGPVLLVNKASPRAKTPWGRRMVLAHELCHLLIDRHAAAPLRVISSAWAPPVLERRANAFAAELLLPKAAIIATLGVPTTMPDEDALGALMDDFGVGYKTCTWHLRNRFRAIE